MKQRTGLLLAVVLVPGLCTGLPMRGDVAKAEQLGEFDCYLLDDGTVAITGYEGDDSTVTIQSELDGYTVTKIENGAFERNTTIRNVEIQNGITEIGSSAFEDCTNLSKVTIPASVKTIQKYAFYNCASLTEITIPSTVLSVGMGAFVDCGKLKTATLNCKSIGDAAFSYCASLTNLTFGDGVEEIGEGAFEECTAISDVTLPKKLSVVKRNTFLNSGLRSVKLNEGLTEIEAYAFYNCKNLENVTLSETITTIGEYAFDGSKMSSLRVPLSVTKIGNCAFGFVKGSFDESVANTEFIVYGVSESAADRYATGNGMLFSPLPQAEKPVFSVDAGTYYTPQSVRITTATEGASVYYTLDGSIPTASANLYTGNIQISKTAVLKAVAMKDGMYNSAVQTATYTIREKATPKITVKTSFSQVAGTKFKIGAKTNSDGKITYKSNKKGVATVNANGQVVCKKAGTATITIKVAATDKYKAATKKVKVKVIGFSSARVGTYYGATYANGSSWDFLIVHSIKNGKVYVSSGYSTNEGGVRREYYVFKNKAFAITGKNSAENTSLGEILKWSGNNKVKETDQYGTYVFTK